MSALAYKEFHKDEMKYQFNPRVAMPEYPRLAQERSKASLRVRKSLKSWLDVPYSNSLRQVLDISLADKPGAPVIVYRRIF